MDRERERRTVITVGRGEGFGLYGGKYGGMAPQDLRGLGTLAEFINHLLV